MFIYAYLPDLVYLDFRHIDEQAVSILALFPVLLYSLSGPRFRETVRLSPHLWLREDGSWLRPLHTSTQPFQSGFLQSQAPSTRGLPGSSCLFPK